jgi:hypothetical protein
MATLDEQILRAWDEWEESTGAEASNPDDFIAWAIENKKIAARMQDYRKLLRKQVSNALRQAVRMDEAGFSYRAKQCVSLLQDGLQLRLWFDIDRGGTTSLRARAVRQRRDGIASDVYRAVCDVEHMDRLYPEEQLAFHLDFSEDYAERRAADLLTRDREEDEDDEAA